MTGIAQNLVVASPGCGCLFTYTVVTHLSEILSELEQRYGQRDQSFTIVGVEFVAGAPQIWFPGDRKHVAVQLSALAWQNETEAFAQLAHEAVHLLNPVKVASVFEEGLAAGTQVEFGRRRDPTYQIGDAKYSDAMLLVNRVIEMQPLVVKTLRQNGQALSAVSADMILAAVPELDREGAIELACPFNDWKPASSETKLLPDQQG